MLKNIEIKETFDKICNCHTCFVKLPIVTAALVVMVLLLSGCSGPMVDAMTTINAIHNIHTIATL